MDMLRYQLIFPRVFSDISNLLKTLLKVSKNILHK